ncbi:hypothetical protein GWK47_004757 [Chionoecetes opilio]|uniref:Uncharacterized protein n=1 Tax=Chionoecetes opilio TaxID=41210 RepID=A0A8J5D0L5_CHIOP|nr:hypothetical protein GWK47_004757 [Chionoecetes opilio]
MASKTRGFSVGNPRWSTGMASSDGLTTKELWTFPPIIFSRGGFGRPPTARRRQFGAVAGERAWGQRGSRPWRHGIADRVWGCPSTQGTQTPPKTGPVSSSNKKGGKALLHFAFVTIPWTGGDCGVRPFFGVFPSPEHPLKNA